MRGIYGASIAGTGIWLFIAAAYFSSVELVAIATPFLVAGCWVLSGDPAPEDDHDSDDHPLV